MLRSLSIFDFAIIDRVDLELEPGLTVITGETGAGKSILISALLLLLGGRARSELIRTGSSRAEVQALFDLSRQPSVRERLGEAGLGAGDELLIRRIISRNGRHRVYINGCLATVGLLSRLTQGLVDVSGQHEHHSLRHPDAQLEILDRVSNLAPLRARVEQAWRELQGWDQRIAALEANLRGRAQREDYLRFQLSELHSAQLKDPDEEEKLEQESVRLGNVARLRQASDQIQWELYSMEGAAADLIARSLPRLEQLVELEPSFYPLLKELSSALAIVEETAHSIGAYGRELSADPRRLEQVEARLALFAYLRKKYGSSIAEVIQHQRFLERELSELSRSEEILESLHQGRAESGARLLREAELLSQARGEGAEALVEAVQGELSDLAMERATLRLRLEPTSLGLRVAERFVSLKGADRVEFLFSANPGEEPLPIHRIASGGELSRFMLAVKRVIAAQDPVDTYLFDEVDTGVGGPTAEAIGRKLKAVSVSRQALCITHLPQIAAQGDQHLHVSKRVERGRTLSSVEQLSHQARVEELARMLGGAQITRTTRANATELIRLAKRS